ncbi:DUF3800 domain-containing protein [Mycobacterium haemophilum]|uniref:DUF3800 domain-containing protein n=1 Tax=Mycobacterium haemophilum TaxID=29311 RepID=UPI0018CDA995|nr:DUF3800 domain-containing protein [Mycobacterium haemophilum]
MANPGKEGVWVLLAYVDESGDEQPLRTETDPPVLVLAAVTVNHQRVKSLVWDFLQLKKTFNDSLKKSGVQLSDVIRFEVKGSELRKDIRSPGRRNRRRAFGLLDSVLKLLEKHQATVMAEIFVKGQQPPSRWVYSNAVAALATRFEKQLAAADTQGCMILDARTKAKNTPSVHRITTSRFKSGGDQVPHLIESPTFGHSDAHVVLQIADLLASAILFPMACSAYCGCLIHNLHLNDEFAVVRGRYASRIRQLERCAGVDGKRFGGVRVIDALNRMPKRHLYEDVPLDVIMSG